MHIALEQARLVLRELGRDHVAEAATWTPVHEQNLLALGILEAHVVTGGARQAERRDGVAYFRTDRWGRMQYRELGRLRASAAHLVEPQQDATLLLDHLIQDCPQSQLTQQQNAE